MKRGLIVQKGCLLWTKMSLEPYNMKYQLKTALRKIYDICMHLMIDSSVSDRSDRRRALINKDEEGFIPIRSACFTLSRSKLRTRLWAAIKILRVIKC